MLIKNHRHEIQFVTRRLVMICVVMAVLMGVVVGQLVNLQLVHHARYTTLSMHNWLELVPVEPTRGLIYDRYGHLLAENIPVFSVDLIPNQITDMNQTLTALSHLAELDDDQIAQFKKQLKQHRRFEEIPLKLTLTEEEVAHIAENQYRLPGVLIKARLMRHYPYGNSFSHVLGYVGRINLEELKNIDQSNYSASHYIGKLGIEKYYEEELHGQVGYGQVEKEASGKPVRVLQEIKATPGKNIYLTLDGPLQLLAEEALDESRGAIIALDPQTGQVLAMVSHPSYDPNLFVQGMPQKTYQQLQSSMDRPLFDRVLHGLYPMASTIKPYLALEALHTHAIDPTFKLFDPGWFMLPTSSHVFHDWRPHGHGWVDLEHAIISSCDTYFYFLAHKMGIEHMDNVLTEFNFGALTGIDLEDERSGTVASPAWKRRTQGAGWYPGDTLLSGIGQGFMQATPLQLAVATSILATRGKHFIPYLQLGEQVPGLAWHKQEPILLNTISDIQPEAWDFVVHAMQEVADSPEGTGFSYGAHPTYTIAMKTGTAQVVANREGMQGKHKQTWLPEQLRDHHLLIAFAPADKPRIVLAIVTENNYQTIHIARELVDYYLRNPSTVIPAPPSFQRLRGSHESYVIPAKAGIS